MSLVSLIIAGDERHFSARVGMSSNYFFIYLSHHEYVNGPGHIDATCIDQDLSIEEDERLFTLWKMKG